MLLRVHRPVSNSKVVFVSPPSAAAAAVLTLLRFSGVAAAEPEPECGLLVLWAPLALLTLEEEEDEEDAGGGVRAWREDDTEDEECDGRLCDEDEDDDGFFFFLTGIGASYVRKDSKDMMGVPKSSSSSLDGESFGTRGRPGNTAEDAVNHGNKDSNKDSPALIFSID